MRDRGRLPLPASSCRRPPAACRLPPSSPTFLPVPSPFDARRDFLGFAKRYLLEAPSSAAVAPVEPPRLTLAALEKIPMSRSRDRILANLEEMYSEAFKRAKASEDETQMASLDFAYRREQLYFEILLDVRDAVERRD